MTATLQCYLTAVRALAARDLGELGPPTIGSLEEMLVAPGEDAPRLLDDSHRLLRPPCFQGTPLAR